MIEENFDPKKSIREYVNEEELKFEIMMMNLSLRLRNLEQYTYEENLAKFEEENNKRIQYYLTKLQENEDLIADGKEGDLSDVGIEAYKKNIEYVKSLTLLDTEGIHEAFNKAVSEYSMYLEGELQNDNISTPRKNYIISDLQYVSSLYMTPRYSKERFGKMLMLIIKNLAVKPSFSGYTDNWKDEFFGNAIEKVLLYSHNFDENLLSKRTGKKSKAFAYITQICFNAFIAIINERKREQKQLKDMVPYETIDGFSPYTNNEVEEKEEEIMVDNHVFEAFYFEGLAEQVQDGYADEVEGGEFESEEEGIVEFFKFQLNYVERENGIFEVNDLMKKEIELLNKTTPQEQRDRDYIMYVRDLEDKIQPCEFIKPIRTIRIVYAENVTVTQAQMEAILKLKPSHLGVEIVKKRTKREKVVYKDPEADLVFGDFDTTFQEEEW